MNKNVVLFHLKEGMEELEKTISRIESEKDYSETDLNSGMGHLYHHLNTAWNGRDQTVEQFNNVTEEDFERCRKFPKEDEFVYLADIDKL